MTNYQELENKIQVEFCKIQELQAEVQRLKQEEKAEQIDLSTCIAGQLVQLRSGNFKYYEYKDEAGFYMLGGDAYRYHGKYYNGKQIKSPYDVVKVFPAEIPVPGGFFPYRAKEVLNGDISCLIASFTFKDTPQGEQYWRDIYEGKTQLSLGDMILIQKWVIQAL